MHLYPLPVLLAPSRDVADGRLPHRGGTASSAGRLSGHLHVRFALWAPRLAHVAAGHVALGGGPCRVCCRAPCMPVLNVVNSWLSGLGRQDLVEQLGAPLLRRRLMTPRAWPAEVGVHLMRYRAARPRTQNTRRTPRHKSIDAPRAQRCADPDGTIPQQLHCAQLRAQTLANTVPSTVCHSMPSLRY
jgi:hypothetical protein